MSTFPDLLKHLGGVPVGIAELLPADAHLLCRSGNYAPHNWFEGKWDSSKYHTNIYSAENALTAGRNDILFVSPDSHPWYGSDGERGTALD